MTTHPRKGLELQLLSDACGDEHEQARRFCLDTIRDVYGFAYRPDWHADLDGLLRPAEHNHYSGVHDGAFWTLRGGDGEMVATTGIRHLAWKPNLLAMFPDRYPRGREIATLCRVYVRKDMRGRGLGRWLTALAEADAHRRRYRAVYLHASSDAPATLSFWRAAGYGFIGTCETSTHFDKQLGPPRA